jgi:hypothetical protein
MNYKTTKEFEPLDDLYSLLEKFENYYGITIETKDYIVGRQQLFYVFMHETLHAFIGKAAHWIYDLSEDETDFIDEVAVRILIDDFIKRNNIYDKVKLLYENHVNHKKELILYGFKLSQEQYCLIEREYQNNYAADHNIDAFCHYIHNKYKEYDIHRNEGFTYKNNE